MYESHNVGLSVIRDIAKLKVNSNDSSAPEEFKQDQLLKISRMENHVAECGELFSIMDTLDTESQENLYLKLLDWRERKPKWTKLSDYRNTN